MAKNSDTSGESIGCFGTALATALVAALLAAFFYGAYCWLTPTDYVEEIESALIENDYQRANKLLREMKEDNRYKKNFLTDAEYPVYVATFNKVIQAEISYLINENDRQASDRLIGFINEYPIDSNPAIGTTHDSDIIEGNDNYNAEVGKFNDYCNQILSRAISTGNQYLAEAIINNFKPTLERKKVDTHLLGNDEYDYQYVESDKDRAKKLLKDAIREGKFDNRY
jgi:hypothetical protein